RNQILQFTGTQDDPMIATSAHQLNLITTDLQESVMKTRMQPIGNVWSKFPRVVRDLAISCEKKASVVMDGADTELDKTIIEAIKDPLTHLVRNAIDHGLETPEVRVAAGKPAEGKLRLYAYHEGGRVNIEISDDGAGINPEVIKAKAIEKGLVTQAEAARLSDRETFHLLFEPGFSTAKVVSNISGRGVGMDVVKTNIEKIGGSVDILSRLGEGTSVKIKIPLTLAIIPALIVRAAGDRFALPQVNLLELVRLEGEQALKSIEMIDKTPIYRLRGKLLPLIYLTKELELTENSNAQQAAADEQSATNIIVLQADDQSFGLVVDEIIDTEEVVVKPLSKQLKHISSLAGATILGDGKIVLILDVLGLAQRANLLSEAAATRSKTDSTREQKTVDHITLLLLRAGQDRRLAIPLSVVSRLEELPIDTLEKAGDQEVVQYRGRVMPLIRLTSVLGIYTEEAEEKESIEVVVCQNGDSVVGLVVDEILDVVDEAITLEGENNSGYVLGATVVQNYVTELLNVKAIMETLDVVLFKHDSSVGNTA
ncbi:chemotaxis protein CheW, partial [Rhodothermus sp. AH-315-K08]|nr:chemotaxis protein CheW [Rhodothermus sp. AH-315-K08]